MSQSDRQSRIDSLIRPTVEALGVDLWGLEVMSQGKNTTLRVFIEREEGVDIEDCERVSRQLSALLDVEDPISGAYALEVSSPGMDRRLFVEEHYKAYVGEEVQVRLRMAFDGQRNFTGQLVDVANDEISVRCNEDEFVFPLESVEKARLVPKF